MGGVLTGLALLELIEIFCISLKYIYETKSILSKHVRNYPVLKDSRMTLKGLVESQHCLLYQS